MSGLRRIAKAFGGLTATDAKSKTVKWAWDYAADEPVRAEEMPPGSDRWKASERARWGAPAPPEDPAQEERGR